MPTTTQKIYVKLNATDAEAVEWWNKWNVDVTLWGVTNTIAVIVNNKPEVRTSKSSWNEYLVWGQIIVPGLSSNVLLFHSKEYNYSNAKIWEWDNEIRINLYNDEDDFKSARGWPAKKEWPSAPSYKLMFKYEEREASTDKEFDFWTWEDITPAKEPVVSVSSKDDVDLPF